MNREIPHRGVQPTGDVADGGVRGQEPVGVQRERGWLAEHACHRVAFHNTAVGCRMLSLTGTASGLRAELPGDELFLAKVELLAGG